MVTDTITIYTDGSCHSQLRTGAWAALLFIGDEKIILKEAVNNTTHNRMELMAVIGSIHYLEENHIQAKRIEIITDSQYVATLTKRSERLKYRNFLTNSGSEIQNADLVKILLGLIETYPMHFIKIRAHQKESDVINYNREADKIVRALMRESVAGKL